MIRVCTDCKQEKPPDEFGYKSKPKLCTDCAQAFYKDVYQQKRGEYLAYRKDYYETNKKAILEKMSNEENKKRRNDRNRLRRQTDPAFRIGESLKVRIIEVLRDHKMDSSSKHLCCTKQQLLHWLEYQFDEHMTWDNYADYWQVDHVIPIKFFDITNRDEQLVCFNWTNLRPYEKSKNISKFNKILEDEILLHCQILNEFVNDNPEYQEYFEKSIWSRFTLEYGDNYKDDEGFKDFLKSIIRIEASS